MIKGVIIITAIECVLYATWNALFSRQPWYYLFHHTDEEDNVHTEGKQVFQGLPAS